MSQTATAPARPAVSPRPAAPLRRPATPPHVWIFHRLTSMRTALTLLFLLGLLTLAGTLLVQVPAAVKGNHQAYAEWLTTVRPRYGGWTDILDKLGLFSVFSSIWFRGAVLLLTASVIACSVRRIPGLWRTATKPRMIMTDAFFERAPHRVQIASGQDQGAALAALGGAFRKHRFRVAVERDGEDVHVCADRFRWSPFGRVAVHVSFIVILIGAVLTGTGGFRDESFTVPIGSRVSVGHGTGMAVEAKSFVDSYYASGPPRNYMSRLVLYKDGARMTEQDARVNHPARYDGLTFYQSFFGPAAVMRASTGDGRVVFNQGVALPYSSQNEKEVIGRFALPQQGLMAFVVSPASGESNPSIPPGDTQLEVYRPGGSAPVGIRVLSPGKPATIAGVKFTFVREGEFTGLTVAHDPGAIVVWIGAALLVLGLFTAFFFPHRRIRAVIRRGAGATEIAVGAIERHNAAFPAQFAHLIEDIRRAVSPGTRPEKGGTLHA
jgi:cytochrome c biogenesis protein